MAHRRILLWAPGTGDPYFKSIKKVLGQKTNRKHNGIIAFVSNTVQKLLQNASQFLQSSDLCPVKRSEDALDFLSVMTIIQGSPFLKTWKSAPVAKQPNSIQQVIIIINVLIFQFRGSALINHKFIERTHHLQKYAPKPFWNETAINQQQATRKAYWPTDFSKGSTW